MLSVKAPGTAGIFFIGVVVRLYVDTIPQISEEKRRKK
jgi:hypothetical protein